LATEWLGELAGQVGRSSRARAKAIASATNNLYFHLSLTREAPAADEVMVKAALISRDAWAKAGGWKERERSEYFVALAYVAADESAAALRHARACLEICKANDAPAYELFFGYEVLAKAAHLKRDADLARGAVTSMKSLSAMLTAGQAADYCRSKLRETEAFIG
jgi:hypothetical protein